MGWRAVSSRSPAHQERFRNIMLVLTDDELAFLGRAFERAWDGHLRAGLLTPQNMLESRRLLAVRILRSAYYGERDEWRLARDAVCYLRQVMGFDRDPIRIARRALKRSPVKRAMIKRSASTNRATQSAITVGVPAEAATAGECTIPATAEEHAIQVAGAGPKHPAEAGSGLDPQQT